MNAGRLKPGREGERHPAQESQQPQVFQVEPPAEFLPAGQGNQDGQGDPIAQEYQFQRRKVAHGDLGGGTGTGPEKIRQGHQKKVAFAHGL